MLIAFLLEFFFYVFPLLLIGYAFFLIVKTEQPRPKGFGLKMALYIIPSLALIHLTFLLTGANTAGNDERKKLRSGIYINPVLGDTIKLSGDSVYMLYAHKKLKSTSQSSGSNVDTVLNDISKVSVSKKNKKAKRQLPTPIVHFTLNEDVASTYKFSQDTILIFAKNWNKKKATDNINHFLKKQAITGDVADEILIKDEDSDKTTRKYNFTLHNDTLTLANGGANGQLVKYIKQYPANGKPATAK